MPNASQAQFPYHWRPPASTRNGVGTAEKGFAIRISPRSSTTSACASCSRSQLSPTSSPAANDASTRVGARPSSTTSS